MTRVFPGMRTCIRSMVGDGDTLIAAFYQVLSPKGDLRTFDFETEFSDGTFITTSNALESARIASPPGILARRFPAQTSPEQLLQVHRTAVREKLAASPDLQATRCHTMEDVIAFQHRMQQVKSAHRQSIGYVTAQDLVMIRGHTLNDTELGVAEELEKLKREQGLGPPPTPR